MHERADERDDHEHDGGQIIDRHAKDDGERADQRDVVEIHPGEIQRQGFPPIRADLRGQDCDRHAEGHRDDGRGQPVPLPGEALAEKDHEHEAAQRQEERRNSECQQCVRSHDVILSVS